MLLINSAWLSFLWPWYCLLLSHGTLALYLPTIDRHFYAFSRYTEKLPRYPNITSKRTRCLNGLPMQVPLCVLLPGSLARSSLFILVFSPGFVFQGPLHRGFDHCRNYATMIGSGHQHKLTINTLLA